MAKRKAKRPTRRSEPRAEPRAEPGAEARTAPAGAPAAPSSAASSSAAPSSSGRTAAGALSLVVPGLGQMLRGRVLTGLLLLAGALVPYTFFLFLLNHRHGVRGGLLSFTFDAQGPVHPPAEHWALFLLGVALHALAVWDARRRWPSPPRV